MYQNQIIKKRQYRENAPVEIQRQRMKAGCKGEERKNSTRRKRGRERMRERVGRKGRREGWGKEERRGKEGKRGEACHRLSRDLIPL